MFWRYENYGTANLLKTSADTVETTKSKYGFAYRTGNHFADFGLPKTAKEIWAKCDAYFTENYSDGDRISLAHRQTADNGSKPDCGFWSGQNKITNNSWFFVNESTSSREISDSSFEKNSIHSFLLHMKSDVSNGIIDLYIDGNLKFTFSGGDVNHGDAFDNFFIYTDGSILVSNVIISNMEIGCYENVAWNRLGLTETPLLFDSEKILAGYDLDKISNSLFEYNSAIKSMITLLLDRIKIYEGTKQSIIQRFSLVNLKLENKYVQNPNLTDKENKLLSVRQSYFTQAFQIGMDDVKTIILNVKNQVEQLELHLTEVNSNENSLIELEKLNTEKRANFRFVMENFLAMITHKISVINVFEKHGEIFLKMIDEQSAWSEDYKAFKTNMREELTSVCRDNGIDEDVYFKWYDDWQKRRFIIEERFLPLIEFVCKGNLLSDNAPAPVERVLQILQSYKDMLDDFYLNERKNIYQKFAFQSGGELQEKFETESELYKLTEGLQRNLSEVIFSREKTEERMFLLRWSEPLLNVPIDEVVAFVTERELVGISVDVMDQFAALKRQNFAAYIADSQAYSEALQKREKEYNALVFRMRKDLQKQ